MVFESLNFFPQLQEPLEDYYFKARRAGYLNYKSIYFA